MADSGDPSFQKSLISFSEFPDDVQLCILSFLSPADLSSFSCTSKFFASLCRADRKLWYALCDRRWGPKTEINKWGNGQVGFKHLYRTLAEYEKLIGFWRRVGDSGDSPVDDSNYADSSALVFFEWGPSSITGSRVSPSKNSGYNVIKTPFIWTSLSSEGEALSYLDPNCRVVSDNPDCSEKELFPVNVNFMGRGHVFLEESRELGFGSPDSRRAGNGWQMGGNFLNSGGEEFNGGEIENVVGSPPERLMSEMYQYFANRMSPGAGGERAWRRQRRRERERRGRRRWEPEHLVKIVDSSPSPSQPLQGLWKGICEDMSLDFYLVSYDDMGGIVCRRVGDSVKALPGGPPVFWTSSATFIESPLSPEEQLLYSTRVHLKPVTATATDDGFEILHSRDDEEVVYRMMCINSSYDLVIPDLAETAVNPRHVEGRIWLYTDGTFGFGFLRNNFIVDLKRIAQDGQILHVIQQEGSGL